MLREEEKRHALSEVMFTFKKAKIYFLKCFFFFLALIVVFYIVSVFVYIKSYDVTKDNVINYFYNSSDMFSIYENDDVTSYTSYDFKNLETYGDSLLVFDNDVSFTPVITKRLKLTDNIYLLKFVENTSVDE